MGKQCKDSNTHKNVNNDGEEEKTYDDVEEVDLASADACLVELFLLHVDVASPEVTVVFLVDPLLQLA